MARKAGIRQRRKQKRTNMFVPRQAQRVLAPSYLLVDEGELRPAVVMEVSRPQGIMGATVRFLDNDFSKLPDGGMRWIPARDMYPDPAFEGRGGVSVETRPTPSGGARIMAHTDIEEWEEIPLEPTPTRRRRRRRTRRAANSPDVQGEKTSLQKDADAAKLPVGRKRRSVSTNQPTSTRRTKVSPATRRRGRTAAAAEPAAEAAKTTARKGRGRKAAAEPESEAKTNGNRRTHEDIVALVPEIVKHLKAGVTMTEIRLGGDTVGETGYGAGPVIRKALAEAGYNTKGEKVEVEDLTTLEGKKLAVAVAELREEGKAWYYLELATDMSQADLKELLEENGYKELASGRVILSEEEEEEPAAKPAGRKRSAAKAKAKAEPEPEAATTGRRRGRRKAANPS